MDIGLNKINEDINNLTNIVDNETYDEFSYHDIPVEIFLHICSYLDAQFISRTLSLVCKRFHSIVSDSNVWKARIGKRWRPKKYPALPVDEDEFNWRLACIEIEDQYKRWTSEDKMLHVAWKDVHYATVDAILLLNCGTLCVSGSRDRSIALWNLAAVTEGLEKHPSEIRVDAHKGWIWDLGTDGNAVYSCSFDTTVKAWSIDDPSLQAVCTFECKYAALSLACQPNLVAVGTHNRMTMLFDPRAGLEQVSSYKAHRGPVLCLDIADNLIVSASEDYTLAVWDLVAGKIVKDNITLRATSDNQKMMPLSVSFNGDSLYAGDIKGNLHLINPAQGKFDIVQTCNIGHSWRLTSVHHSLGILITGSTDGYVRVFAPTTEQPETVATLKSDGGEVTAIHYQNNILAAAGTDCAVEIWMPDPS